MAVVFDPKTDNRIVISDARLQEYLGKGYISDAQYQEEQKALQAQKYQEWLNNPETEEERFRMLRQIRDAKITATDYLMTSDYPISAESKAAVEAYRTALRNLPAQSGAPWDGGGELTPWPVMPKITK